LEHKEADIGGRPGHKYGKENGKDFYWGIRWGFLYKIDRADQEDPRLEFLLY